jgi:hypothetical protein
VPISLQLEVTLAVAPPAMPLPWPFPQAKPAAPRPCTMGVMDHHAPIPHLIDALLRPDHLFTRQEVLSKPSPVPARPGVYAWYFREVPPGVPVEGCRRHHGLPLLYVGISPSRPPTNGKPPSKQSLAKRIRYHFTGNAEGSTLRLTLGCLLADTLGIKLTRVGSGVRYTFTNPGEIKLDEWMAKNALVCWVEHPRPWELEEELLKTLSLPLNLDGNEHHSYYAALSVCRKVVKAAARAGPCLLDSGGPRRLSTK